MRRLLLNILFLTASPWVIADSIFFSADFADKDGLSDWKVGEPPNWAVNEDGQMQSIFPEGTPFPGCRSPFFEAEGDLRFEFDFCLNEAREVQFKVNHTGGGHLYRLMISNVGVKLRVNRNQQIPIPEASDVGMVQQRLEPNEWYTLVMESRDGKVTVQIDEGESHEFEIEWSKYPVGSLGLASRGGDVLLDNIVVAAAPGTEKKDNAAVLENEMEKRIPASVPASTLVPHKTEPVAVVEDLDPILEKDWLGPLDDFLARHCFDCHDDAVMKGELDMYSLGTDLSDPETLRIWVRIFDRVKAGEMPPEKKPRPEEGDKTDFLAALQPVLVAGHELHDEVVLRRLNRLEYENTVNDLFGLDMRLAELFPEDAQKHGFDNNGSGLTLSTELIELYLKAAHQVVDRIYGHEEKPEPFTYDGPLRPLISENMFVRWGKLMEVDGATIVYSSNQGAGTQLSNLKLPVEGRYRFRFHLEPWQSEAPVMFQVQTGILTRSGDKRFHGYYEIPPGGRVVEVTDWMVPGESIYPRPFGTMNNIAAFTAPSKGKLTIHDYEGTGLAIKRVEIEGPLDPTPTVARQQLFQGIDPATATVNEARKIFERLLPRAFRRPVTGTEVFRYTSQVKALLNEGRTFEEAMRWGLVAMLTSADFLFLDESRANDEGEIDDYALASRLSYFLWSSLPDGELRGLAASGRIRDPEILQAQAERLLRDEKADAFTRGFAHQWLDLREIDATSPDTKLFPEFEDFLKFSMVRESEAFFEEVLGKNHSIREFIDSDWLMLNPRLAKHYGIKAEFGGPGEEFQRVSLPQGHERGGILTQASVLKVTANGANTSPVNRGVWTLENLLGIHPPPPPPGIPAVVPDVSGAKTLRQLLDAHRDEESCASCHQKIDPPGFALESFDPVGASRNHYLFQGSRKRLPVDATGVTSDGQIFRNIQQFKEILQGEIEQVSHGLAEKLLTYATGRAMGFSDREEIHRLVETVSEDGYPFRDLIHAVVQSEIFRQP
ncbi:MAG: DUF1592 domain-containing protein [Verrucomicrobiota bacterium]